MDIKYSVVKLKDGSTEEVKDSVSVEEPLEMSLKYKIDGKWVIDQLSITMRTPGKDWESCNQSENVASSIQSILQEHRQITIQNRWYCTSITLSLPGEQKQRVCCWASSDLDACKGWK